MTPTGTSRLYRPPPGCAVRDERWGGADASATATPESVVITVRGEIDASNGTALANYVERHLGIAPTLVLDLSEVGFFGTAGLAALRRIDRCSVPGGWNVIAGPAGRRTLRACRAVDLLLSETVAAEHHYFGRRPAMT